MDPGRGLVVAGGDLGARAESWRLSTRDERYKFWRHASAGFHLRRTAHLLLTRRGERQRRQYAPGQRSELPAAEPQYIRLGKRMDVAWRSPLLGGRHPAVRKKRSDLGYQWKYQRRGGICRLVLHADHPGLEFRSRCGPGDLWFSRADRALRRRR